MDVNDKPFVCPESNCRMRFANEDHLTVHKQKHEMSLNLNTSSSKLCFADQTPTPTRFIKNCDEVGLFNDLQHVNPFDEQFRRASQSGSTPVLSGVSGENCDSLNTPCIPPGTADVQSLLLSAVPMLLSAVPKLHQESHLLKGSSNFKEEMSDTMPFTNSLNEHQETMEANVVEAPLPIAPIPAKVHRRVEIVTPKMTPSNLVTSIIKVKGKGGQTPVITSVGACGATSNYSVRKVSGVPTAVVVKPPSIIQDSLKSSLNHVPILAAAHSVQTTRAETVPVVQNVVQNASVVQFILKLQDGQSMPFSLPIVANSPNPMLVQPVITQNTVHTTASPVFSSIRKIKLKDALDRENNIVYTTAISSSVTASSAVSSVPKVTVRPTTVTLRAQSPPSVINNLVATVQPTLRMAESISSVESISNSGRRKREENYDDLPDDEKRRKFLERNRAAATRCRQKRKQWVNELERRAEDLEKTNMQLQVRYQSEVAILRKEVAQLKTMLLAHKDCPITQQQIASGQTDVASLTTIALDLQSLLPTSTATNIANFASLTGGGAIREANLGDYEIIQVDTNGDALQENAEIIIGQMASDSEEDSTKSFPGSSG